MTNRIFLVGDFKTNTGPAIANKALKKALTKKNEAGVTIGFSSAKSRIGRLFEVFWATIRSDAVCYCGFSELNVFGIRIAKLLRKKSAYLMHGYVELESELNHFEVDPKRIKAERYILKQVDTLICVSELLATKVKERYPKRKNVHVVYNIVGLPSKKSSVHRNKLQVMSTGGGMPQKNNLIVCEAIKKINKERSDDKKIKYVIIGKSYGLEKEFLKYDFVDYLGEVSHERCIELMQESKVYIQNSLFETFGLAVIEAVGYGCSVLVSDRIGALGVFSEINEKYIIHAIDDLYVLKRKLANCLLSSIKLNTSVDWKKLSGDYVCERFLSVLEVL